MTLQALKNILTVTTGTAIGQVFFDWQAYLNETRSKTYPCVLWSLGGAKFTEDKRTATLQKVKELTLTCYAISNFNISTDDKITVWDTLEAQFNTYLNAMDSNARIKIANINEIKGEYVPEGMISADVEIGIMFTDVKILMYCS